jgi:DnaJ-domain-containing protein 1
MTDFFALLQEPRRPLPDLEALKQRFLIHASAFHPDRVHSAPEAAKTLANQRYAELNAAFQCLSEPKDRLLHLMELEAGKPKDIQRIPPGTMDMFIEVGQLCREVDAFLAERAKATSPLLKVRFFEQGMDWTDKLNALQQRLNAKRDELNAELAPLNETWAKAPAIGSPERVAALPLERLEQIYRTFSYLWRWSGQIQERSVQLSM